MSERQMKAEINKRVQERYDWLMGAGVHGHYENMFMVVHEERAQALKPFLDWYDADQADSITISRDEMGVLVGRHPTPRPSQEK